MFIKVVLFFVFVLSFGAAVFGQEINQNSPGEIPAPKIISKLQPVYTEAARKKKVEGEVYLRVTFLASGEIGDVVYLKESSKKKKLTKYGLVAQAIEAAKKIKFEPARRNGERITTTKIVVFAFTIY